MNDLLLFFVNNYKFYCYYDYWVLTIIFNESKCTIIIMMGLAFILNTQLFLR